MPEAKRDRDKPEVRFWPTDDGPQPLTAYPKPDAQGAAPKVSFVVLRSQVAGTGFGQKRKFI